VSTAKGAAAGTITVYVTETGLTGGSPTMFALGLTNNFLSPGWSATETIYENNKNSIFGKTASFSTFAFTPTTAARPTREAKLQPTRLIR
jgi:hypothetical protein